MVGALLLAALAVGPRVFPERLCTDLPEAGPEVKAWIAAAAPEIIVRDVRELGEEAALESVGRASAAGWASTEYFTNIAFREPCALYLSREVLHTVDAAYKLDLLAPIAGRDTSGKDFEMTAALAGRGRLLLFYDRDGIVYRNEREDRDFKLASRVELDAPAPRLLRNVRGLWARIWAVGWVGIRSIAHDGDKVEVRAGPFTSEATLRPIHARTGAARAVR